ncbi:MAG: nitroreductase [Acidimicrobiales bacterium]
MDLRETIERRMSVRAFTDTPVSDELIRDLLALASRSPSGGNVQPWRIYVVNGESRDRLVDSVYGSQPEKPEYPIYPEKLWEPYRTNRFELGEAMYETMGIERHDKAARFEWIARNQQFFGAPAGLFCFVDRGMNKPQWSDLGMFLQTFMLLAVDAGLDTCAQESWSVYPRAVASFCGAPDELMLFCGMAIGYRDSSHPVNTLRSARTAVDDFASWV